MIKYFKIFFAFLSKEWLMTLSFVLLVSLSFYLHTLPHYIPSKIIPIFLLLALFISVKGIEDSGLLCSIALYLEKGNFLAPKLIIGTFLLSILLTIDVTLVTMLPLILTMNIQSKKTLLLLVAFTAHIGAALTPFGTPQNLFIFSFYQIDIISFIKEIAPFTITFFILFLILSFFIKTDTLHNHTNKTNSLQTTKGIVWLIILLIVILIILRFLPWWMGTLPIIVATIYNRNALKVDYPILITFILFLGIANLVRIELLDILKHPAHIFILSTFMSQFISNVPTTLILHQFTSQWEALLWGTNVGGFGTPVAALANLITWRIYAKYYDTTQSNIFAWEMTFWGFVLYGLGVVLYFVLAL